MWHPIKYLYYKLFKLFVRINGEDDSPEYTAMFTVGLLFFFNILSIASIINLVYQFTTYPSISRTNFFVLFGLPYYIIFYFILFLFLKENIRGLLTSLQTKVKMTEKKEEEKLSAIYYFHFCWLFCLLYLSVSDIQNYRKCQLNKFSTFEF